MKAINLSRMANFKFTIKSLQTLAFRVKAPLPVAQGVGNFVKENLRQRRVVTQH